MDTEADQSRSINHHGSVRKVFDAKISGVTNMENGFMLPKTSMLHIAKFFRKYFLLDTHKIVSNNSYCIPTVGDI